MLPILLALLALLTNLNRPAQADDAFSDGAVKTDVEGKTIQVGYTKFPATFDPNKPTIVYVMGGPVLFSDRHSFPQGLPAGYQVLRMDYVGTSRDGKSFPSFTNEQIMKGFTIDRQSAIIRDIIKKENLAKYVMFGESHGVQLSARAIDKIQRDPTIVHKPIAAFLDSGMGRRINTSDIAAQHSKGEQGPHGKCQQPEGDPKPSSPNHDQPFAPYLNSYLITCHLENLSSSDRAGLLATISRLMPPSAARLPTKEAVQSLTKLIGCPPADKINYGTWAKAMSCGVFEKGVGNNSNCSDRCNSEGMSPLQKKQCAQFCKNAPNLECQDTPLDAKTYQMGDTKILGIQSLDDCQNWVESMDYLMANLRKTPGAATGDADFAYLRVSNAGGHVTFRSTQAFARCREPLMSNRLFEEVFGGDVASAKSTLQGCYNDGASEADLDPAKSVH